MSAEIGLPHEEKVVLHDKSHCDKIEAVNVNNETKTVNMLMKQKSQTIKMSNSYY